MKLLYISLSILLCISHSTFAGLCKYKAGEKFTEKRFSQAFQDHIGIKWADRSTDELKKAIPFSGCALNKDVCFNGCQACTPRGGFSEYTSKDGLYEMLSAPVTVSTKAGSAVGWERVWNVKETIWKYKNCPYNPSDDGPGPGCFPGSPIYLERGDFFQEESDLSILLKNSSFSVHRKYSSKHFISGPLGNRWRLNHNIYLVNTAPLNKVDPTLYVMLGDKKIVFEYDDTTTLYRALSDQDFSLLKNVSDPINHYVLSNTSGTQWTFNQSKQVVAMITPQVNYSYEYDNFSRLVKILDANQGSFFEFLYNEANKISSITDSFGRNIQYTYDNENNLTTVVDPEGYSQQYEYYPNTNGLIKKVYNKNGFVEFEAEYDENQEVVSFKEYSIHTDVVKDESGISEIEESGKVQKANVKDSLLLSREQNGIMYEIREYNDERQLERLYDNNQQEILYQYDDNANKISEMVLPKYEEVIANIDILKPQYKDIEQTKSWAKSVVKTVYTSSYEIQIQDPQSCSCVVESEDSTNCLTPESNHPAFQEQAAFCLIEVQTPLLEITQQAPQDCSCITSSTDSFDCLNLEPEDPIFNLEQTFCATEVTEITTELDIVSFIIKERIESNLSSEITSGSCENKGRVNDLTQTQKHNLFYGSDGKLRTQTAPYFILKDDVDKCPIANKKDLPGLLTTYDYVKIGVGYYVSKKNLPDGNFWEYSYDSQANLVAETSPAGIQYFYEYNPLNLLSKKLDGTGTVLEEYTYDPIVLKVKTLKNALGNIKVYNYDQRGNKISESDYQGNVTQYEYNLRDELIKKIYPADHQNQVRIEIYEYDGEGNKITTIDGNGNVTRFEYNEYNQQVKMIYPDLSETTSIYDGEQLIEKIEPGARSTHYEYNQLDQLVKATDSIGNTIILSKDISGNILSQTDRRGNTSYSEYDSSYRLVKSTDSEGNITTRTFDEIGNIVEIILPDGETLKNEYKNGELLEREIKHSQNKSLITSYVYNSLGLKIKSIDPKGNITQFVYDDNQRLIKTIDPTNNEVATQLDANANPVSFTNEKGKIWQNQHNALNEEQSQVTPLGNITQFEYDLNGNLTKKVWPEGNYQVTQYNSKNLKENVFYYDKSDLLQDQIQFDYDEAYNLTSVTSQNQTIIRSYNKLNLLTLIEIPSLNRQIKYTYDENLNRATKMIYNTQSQLFRLTSYEYNKNNKLSKIHDDGNTTSFHYSKGNKLYRIDYPNGMIRSQNFDVFGRLESMIYEMNEEVVQKFIYERDDNGNKTKETTLNGETNYIYNSKNQLVRADYPNGEYEEFSYDSAGNRTVWNKNGEIKSFSFNDSNQVISSSDSLYNYDDNGSLISKDDIQTSTSTLYTYNTRNKLESVNFNDGTSNIYEYYPESDLRYSSSNKSGTTSFFTYDDNNESEVFSSDKIAITTFENVPDIYDFRLYKESASSDNLDYYISDNLNSVRGTLQESSSFLEQEYNYYAYGDLRNGDPLKNLDFSFTGRVFDQDTNLYNYRGRYMDSCSGSFTQVDPMQDGNNWYSYVEGNPINYTDPTGYISISQVRNSPNSLGGSKNREPVGFTDPHVANIRISLKPCEKLVRIDPSTNNVTILWETYKQNKNIATFQVRLSETRSRSNTRFTGGGNGEATLHGMRSHKTIQYGRSSFGKIRIIYNNGYREVTTSKRINVTSRNTNNFQSDKIHRKNKRGR